MPNISYLPSDNDRCYHDDGFPDGHCPFCKMNCPHDCEKDHGVCCACGHDCTPDIMARAHERAEGER